MNFHPLSLSINPGSWRMYMSRKSNPGFLKARTKVWARDDYTCQFCGFQAQDYQEIINLDNDYYNNKLDNLVTSCVFCAQCLFVESIGNNEFGGGTLIYCPEIPQNDINSLCHVLFCAISNGTGYRESAQNTYRSLKFRSQLVEKQFGDGTSDPAVFGRLLIEAYSSEQEAWSRILKDLRLLPSRVKFKTLIDHWAAAALTEESPALQDDEVIPDDEDEQPPLV